MRKTFWEFFIDNVKFTYIVLASIVAMGLFSTIAIPKESNPEVEVPIAVVVTPFPGASAVDVELLVTNPIEERLTSLDGISEIASASNRGLSTITIQFDADVDGAQKLFDVKDRVDQVKSDLPSDVEDSSVTKISFDDVPVLTVALSGPFDRSILTEYADQLKDEIERAGGVSDVQVIGDRTQAMRVFLDRARMNAYGIGFAQVLQAIRTANTDIPLGAIETAQARYTVRFDGQIDDVEELKQTPIRSNQGAVYTLGDIASVHDGYDDIGSLSRLSIDGGPSNDAITLRVFKSTDADIIDTVTAAQAVIAEYPLPEGIAIRTIEDTAEIIREDLSGLFTNGMQTVIIVFLVLLVFLGLKEALLAGIAIPLTFMMTFTGLSAIGYTLNFLTLFSLILALGILVDSAIVMTEAIHTGRNAGKDVETAVREAIREFRYPLISGTLTTVFAFVPMLLTSGIIGEFIKSIPVTITIVLMSSLFIALAILTTLSLRVFDKETSEEKNKLQSYIHHRIERIRRMYERTLHILLHGTKLRRMFFGALVVMLVGSFALVPTGILPVNMFPPDDQSSFFIDLRYPIGTPLSQTDEGIRQLEERVKQDTRVDMVSTNVGSLSNSGSAVDIGGPGDTHLAHLIVNLQDDRDESSEELVEAYQQTLAGSIPGATISVKQLSSGPGDAAPVEIRISGDDLSTLDQLAEQFRDFLETVPGTQNVDVSVKPTNGEFVFAINRAAANRYGVTAQDVAFTLRGAIAGSDATVLRSGGDDIDVAVQYAFGRGYDPDTLAPGSISIDQLNALLIQTPRGDIPLSQLGTISLAPNRSVVSHFDTERVIRVTSYTKPGVTPQAIFAQAAEHLETMTLPAGYSVVMGGENEDINKSFQDMAKAFVLAVFLIAGLLVLQFNSFKQPIYILVSIPLSLIGVLPGLVLVNLPLSFPGIIGIVALAGIVVNNAIILIDKININRQEGLSVVDAVEEAAISRFQPIVLTTITTIAGLLPLAISDPVWGPVAYSVIFGLSFSTILTLLVIPLLYRGFEREA